MGRVTMRPRDVNWKNVGDNYSDGLHIPVAHPGLTRLFGKSYGIEAEPHVDRMWGDLVDRPSANWSERAYQNLLPAVPHLAQRPTSSAGSISSSGPRSHSISIPDQVDFMQWLPTGPTSCIIREISYVLPDERREMKRRALSQLADQPAGQCRGYAAHYPRPARHGKPQLFDGATVGQGSVPQKLLRANPRPHPRSSPRTTPRAGLEP